ncbi:putative bimb_emeni cell division-associated protein bimb [Diplodia seriata]|uniref:separase n=1 Tax=Diplodia seriata TaxID=420778 RepID=A0A0G2E082_9PEZI|nr:putative bimb_emeni cell division-associated protein bimb [Diplodia seriata]
MSIALLKCPPLVDEVQEPIRSWQNIFDHVDSWAQLATFVDAFEAWMSQLQMVSDFLGMKSMDFLRVPVLSTMCKALELQEPLDFGKLVQALASLGAQYARLGYSGKAGTVLAKAQGILETGSVPAEAVLQWHLAYAEYMLVLGNLDKCAETLSAARELAESDPVISSMSAPKASFSTKLRHYRLLSEASHVYSLLSLSSGYPSEALAYAKQCVNLNRKIWLTMENIQNLSHSAEIYLESNRLEDAMNCLEKAGANAKQLSSSIDLARFHTTGAQLRQLMDNDDDAVEEYDKANKIIQDLSDSGFIQNLEKLSNSETEISNKMSNMKLEDEPSRTRKAPARPSYLSIADTPSPIVPVAKKGAKGKKASKEDVSTLLKKARDCIAEVQSQAVHTSSTSAVQRVCSMLNEVTILLSATTPKGAKGSLHPLYAAYLTELPKTNASKLEQEAVSIEHQKVNRETLLGWPGAADGQEKPLQLTAADFQADYVNIIPQGWTAVSLSLNEAQDELYITRYVPWQSPFILRLPMARHNSRDMDEEIFGFEEGKAELKEIIELSDFSTRHVPDLSKKGAKTGWWAEREALDARLGDLLANIENIWLGGFRGIFKKKGNRASLSRFSKSFENILDRHLPSRQGKGTKSKTSLDWRILELFVGLGNPEDGVDLDEPLMDLVYFVVDILQFNGERNAYDEIDFDSIIIEMLDALRSFHEAAEPMPNQHTILILDKNLHAFPWESLPSLQSLSISRLPSMSALRERLIAARASKQHISPSSSSDDEDATDDVVSGGHHIAISTLTGTSVLNPGGDLTRTQETLAPHVKATPGMWHHLIGRVPDETTLETSLAKKDVLLYFGHGSGAQYIRGRTVKKLLCSRREHALSSSSRQTSSSPSSSPDAEEEEQGQQPPPPSPSLATSLLFGCSSAHVTDNGAFEPSGMLCAYLTAGVPAVLGMLWDVTDKDCDRFAIATLQRGAEDAGEESGFALENA